MKQLIFLVILGEFILGCREVKNNQNNVNEKTMETTSEEGYYFQMDTVKQKEFLKKISLLSIGDTLSNVLNILGKPDYDQIGMRKERDEFICRTLTFYVAKWKKDLVNEIHDKSVELRWLPVFTGYQP